jgi:hypothetical protein
MFWIYRDGGGSITTVELGQVSPNVTFYSLCNLQNMFVVNLLKLRFYFRDNMQNSSIVA